MTTFLDHVGLDAGDQLPVRLETGPQHANRNGTIHGGLLATMLDSACGAQVRSGLDEGKSAATVSLTVTYLLPGTVGRTLTAEAKTLHRGSSLVMVEGDIHDEEGEHLAHATGTFTIVDQD